MWRTGLVVRVLLLALVFTVLPPGGQVIVHAQPEVLSETLEDLPEDASSPILASEDASADDARLISRSDIVESSLTFNLLGVVAPEDAEMVRVRTGDGDAWGNWSELAFFDEEDGPDAGSLEEAESEARVDGKATEPLWVGEATHFQIEVEGASVSDVRTTVIDSMGSSGGPVERTYETAPAAGAQTTDLDVVSRSQWGADESLRNGNPRYASEVHMGIVHHTAHNPDLKVANSYSRAEAPGIVRAMYRYHTQSLGWADLGYNVVIDRFGTVYEGRAGGFAQPVIGAHASGYNTGSFGVAVIGNFVQEQASSAALDSLEKVIGIKSAIHGVDPEGWTDRMGNNAWRPTIVGHKDVGNTACPGKIHDRLPELRAGASQHSMRFPDVSTSSPHRPAILALADTGVATGCRLNEYCPEQGLNRGQASSFLLRAFELDPVPGYRFPDVDVGGAHTGAINALADRGWLQGYEDGRFGPWDQLTRGQLATLLAGALDLPMPTPWQDPYPDVSRSSTHAPAIAALKDVGIVGNCGSGRFCANDIALRDSTASFIHMALEYRADLRSGGAATDGEQDDDSRSLSYDLEDAISE